MRKLSTIQQDVDRSFEKALRSVLVANGYGILITDPMTPNDYDLAKQAIINAKGFAVDLYGNGSPEDRENLLIPRIVITGMGFGSGSAGTPFGDSFEYDPDSDSYIKYSQGAPLSNYRLRVELWSNTTDQDRILEAVRASALPNLNYIEKWNDPDTRYLITYAFTASIPQLVYGLTHKIYTYEAIDIEEVKPNQVATGISPIKRILVEETDIRSNEVFDDSYGEAIIVIPPEIVAPPEEDGQEILNEDTGLPELNEDTGEAILNEDATQETPDNALLNEDTNQPELNEDTDQPIETE